MSELDYQKWAANKLRQLKRAPLFGRMGSGKTKILLDAIFDDPDYDPETSPPILVLCGGNSIGTWKYEPHKWWGVPSDKIAVARGPARGLIWKDYRKYRVIITTYGTLLKDHALIVNKSWFAILADESHKWRNKKSKTYKIMKGVARATTRFHPATGTPYRKGPQNIFTMLNLCYPKVFKSYWKFVNAFCLVSNMGYGQDILGPRNIPNLIKMLDRYAVDIPDEVVEKELPPGSRIPISVELSETQQKLYDELDTDLIAFVPGNDNIVVSPTILSKITKLRQLLVCPKLWDPDIDDYGAGISVIADRLEEDNHAIIFVPFTKAMPYLKEYLESRGHKSIGILQGQISDTEQTAVIKRFEQDRGIILCSVLYAESFSLPTCEQAYFLGPDWSFDVNEQAEGRIRRRSSIGKHAYWYYLKHLGTVEDEVVMTNINQNYKNVQRIKKTSDGMRSKFKGNT